MRLPKKGNNARIDGGGVNSWEIYHGCFLNYGQFCFNLTCAVLKNTDETYNLIWKAQFFSMLKGMQMHPSNNGGTVISRII